MTESKLVEIANSGSNLNEPVTILCEGYSVKTTYLSLAISLGSLKAVEALLENGADPNTYTPNYSQKVPLLFQLAIFTGSTKDDAINNILMTKMLLDHGADPDQIITDKGKSVYEYHKGATEISYDPSSDYDYRRDSVFLELLEAKRNGMLETLDMTELLEVFDE